MHPGLLQRDQQVCLIRPCQGRATWVLVSSCAEGVRAAAEPVWHVLLLKDVFCVSPRQKGDSVALVPVSSFFFGLVAGDAFVISDLDPTFLSSCCWTQGEGTYLYAAGFWIAVHVGGCCDSLGLVAFPSLVRDTHGKPCIHHWRSPSQ